MRYGWSFLNIVDRRCGSVFGVGGSWGAGSEYHVVILYDVIVK